MSLLKDTHPHLFLKLGLTKNHGELGEVASQSNKKLWWTCSLGHEWETSVKFRTKGRNCRVCGKKESQVELLAQTELERVFALPLQMCKRPLTDQDGRKMKLDSWYPELGIAFEVQDLATHSKVSNGEVGAFLGWSGFKKG